MMFSDSQPIKKSVFPGNFGAIRLLMALLVIIGHTPELVDGNRERELFTTWFGGISFGEAAVDGFFLISGYMLSLSVVKSGSLANYFIKRVARIYPAFIVSFIVCILVVNPLAGGTWTIHELLSDLVRLVLLQPPRSDTAFAGAPYPALNGAMWTISYEFFCYILLAVVFSLGILKRRGLLLGLIIAVDLLLLTRPHLDLVRHEITFGGNAQNMLRFIAAFCTGVGYRQFLTPAYRKGWLAVVGAILLPITLSYPFLAEPSLIVIGGYVLIVVGEARVGELLSRIGQETDLSYGVYLYAWPIQNLLIWKYGVRDLVTVDLMTIAASCALALVSWTIVERPAMRAAIDLTRRTPGRRGTADTPMVVEDAGAP